MRFFKKLACLLLSSSIFLSITPMAVQAKETITIIDNNNAEIVRKIQDAKEALLLQHIFDGASSNNRVAVLISSNVQKLDKNIKNIVLLTTDAFLKKFGYIINKFLPNRDYAFIIDSSDKDFSIFMNSHLSELKVDEYPISPILCLDINSSYDYDNFVKECTVNSNKFWFPSYAKNDNSVEALTNHELGHILFYVLFWKANISNKLDYSKIREIFNQNQLEKFGKDLKKAILNKEENLFVSGYGKTDEVEWFAEAFSIWVTIGQKFKNGNNVNDQELSKEFMSNEIKTYHTINKFLVGCETGGEPNAQSIQKHLDVINKDSKSNHITSNAKALKEKRISN